MTVAEASPFAAGLTHLARAEAHPVIEVPVTRLEREFSRFHGENPWVLLELIDRAQRLSDAGSSRFGISLLIESLRFDMALQGVEWGVSNAYRSLYARLLLSLLPELDGVLVIRHAPALHGTMQDGWT